jgi:hypothetical protein
VLREPCDRTPHGEVQDKCLPLVEPCSSATWCTTILTCVSGLNPVLHGQCRRLTASVMVRPR